MTIAQPLGFQVIAVPTKTAHTTASKAATQKQPGLLRRLFDSVMETREHRAQRAVDDYVARQGARLTDSIEREIGERMMRDSGWNFRR